MRNLSVHSLLLAALLLSAPALAQPVVIEEVKEGPKKQKGPTKSEWVAAGLDPAEYTLAIDYDVHSPVLPIQEQHFVALVVQAPVPLTPGGVVQHVGHLGVRIQDLIVDPENVSE